MATQLEQYLAAAFGIGLLILLRYLSWKSTAYPTFTNFIIIIGLCMIVFGISYYNEYKKFI
jgi:hypothetical protein